MPKVIEYPVVNGFKIVTEDKEFKFKSLCPYCKGNLKYRATGWELDENELWKVDSLDCDCSNEPKDMESDEWEEWLRQHSEMPYVYQFPVDNAVKKYINEKYRFKID